MMAQTQSLLGKIMVILNNFNYTFNSNLDAIKLGESFLIRWLRVEDLNYSVCSDLKNAICNNEPLTSKPKDC